MIRTYSLLLLTLVLIGGCADKPVVPPKDTRVPTAGLVEGGNMPGVGGGSGAELKSKAP